MYRNVAWELVRFELDTFLKFIEERGIKEGDKAVAQAKDTAIVNIKVLSENGSGLKSYFS